MIFKKSHICTHIHLGISKGFIDVTEHRKSETGEGEMVVIHPSKGAEMLLMGLTLKSQRGL